MAKIIEKISFNAKLHRPAEGGDWTFLRLPLEASQRLPTRSMVAVEGTLEGAPFQHFLEPDGEGGHWLKVEPELQIAAAAKSGCTVEVTLWPALTQPEPEVPGDLQAALEAFPPAMATWSKTTPIARRDWIQWLTSGKKVETRGIRLEKMMDMLAHGKKRICCFDRSGMYSKSIACPVAADEA